MMALILACCEVLGGCSSSKTINPSTDEIDIKVYLVLGVGEQPGNQANNGCRLTQAEVTSIVRKLQSNASVFGTNVIINWNGSIIRVDDTQASSTERMGTTDDFVDVLLYYGTVPSTGGGSAAPAESPNVVNIYFAGNFGDVPVWGATVDPKRAFDLSDPNPTYQPLNPGYIRINDGGLEFGPSDPTNIILQLALEHEMEHYLARFAERIFGTGISARLYNDGEHVEFGTNLLVDEVPIGSSRSLTIPGQSWPSPQYELGEISQRIQAGTWNLP